MKRELLCFVLVICTTLVVAQKPGLKHAPYSPYIYRMLQQQDTAAEHTFVIQFKTLQTPLSELERRRFSSVIVQRYDPASILVLRLSLARLSEVFGDMSTINFVDVLRKPMEEMHIDGFDPTANGINTIRAMHPDRNGAGIGVSIKEQRFDSSDIDFRGRTVSMGAEAANTTTHATQMATMVGGGGNASDFSFGAGWGATLSSSSFETLLPDPAAVYESGNVSVQNHSYGTGIENYYGADALAYDATVRQFPYLLHVFSAGNSGDLVGETGNYAGIPGFANLTGSFKMAKNILTVGATDSLSRLEPRSSRGPAYDGRIKPEVVAYGHDGSSGAAAIVSGIATTLQQNYMMREGHLPDAALTRAILMNSADDLENPGPDFRTGFGMVNGPAAHQTLDSGWYRTGSIASGETTLSVVNVPAGVRRLKLMVSWTDPEALANAPNALVNNLDLKLKDPGNVTHLPWTLDRRQAHLADAAVPGIDSVNNMEQVTIDNPQAGDYTVDIQAGRVISGPQAYAITWILERSAEVQWRYPSSGDQLTAGTRNLLRWSWPGHLFGTLSVSFDGAQTWRTLQQINDLSKGTFEWQAPDTNAVARLRIESGMEQSLSPEFYLSRPLETTLAISCADSAVITWKRPAGTERFNVYRLEGAYMRRMTATTDTFAVVRKSESLHYAVAPLLGDSSGQRGYTFNINNQGVGCYSNNLLADLLENGDVIVRFTLGTNYQVASITLERRAAGDYVPLTSVQSPSTLKYEWIDSKPVRGIGYYRVKILLTNGYTVISTISQVNNPGASDFVLFPNPVKSGSNISLLSKDTENAEWRVYDLYGRLVFRKELFQQIESLKLFTRGLYTWQIWRAGKRMEVGKIIVQ